MSFLSFLSETFLRTRIDQGESLTILRRTYQTATSRNRLWRSTIPDLSTAISQPLWRPFKQPNRVSDGVSIRPVQSDKETIDNTGSRPTGIVSRLMGRSIGWNAKIDRRWLCWMRVCWADRSAGMPRSPNDRLSLCLPVLKLHQNNPNRSQNDSKFTLQQNN